MEKASKDVVSAVDFDSSAPAQADSGDLDDAYAYLQTTKGTNITEHTINLRNLRRRLDWHIIPLCFLCYTIQFLDKVALNYAAVMGLNGDLKLKGNEFSNAATFLFVAQLIAEAPNGFFLQKMPAARWLGLNVTLWGVATACTAAATNYPTLLTARIFVGIFEGASAPSLMLISSNFYTKAEAAPRISLWYCGVGFAQIIGGLCSFGFQHVSPTAPLAGWRIMFVVLGLATVTTGSLTFFFLPSTPMGASFLSDNEKVVLLEHVSVNRTGVSNKHFRWVQVLDLLTDPQIYFLVAFTVLTAISSGVITNYSTTIIRNFGFSAPNAALLNIPSGLVTIIATVVVGFGVRHTSQRWAWLNACTILGVTAGGLISYLSSSNRVGLLIGIYLINCIIPTMSVIYNWAMANIAGQTKRVLASALIAGSFAIGNIIGPQTFQAKDAPQYSTAKVILMATQAAALVVICLLALYYLWANRRRDKRLQNADVDVQADTLQKRWKNETDREDVLFRYTY